MTAGGSGSRVPRFVLFGPFRIDRADERLWQGREAIGLGHKAFTVLCSLADRAGRLVSKEQLLADGWPGSIVGEAVLTTAVRELRRALGDDARDPSYIETVHGRGYRFVAPVAVSDEPPAAEAPPPAGPSRLVGRVTEWRRLEQALAAACEGQRQVLFIAGEAGIGKTALVEAFVASAAVERELIVGHGQCVEHYGAGEAYLPVLEALERIGRGAQRGRLIAILQRHAPSWLPHLPGLADSIGAEAARSATSARMLRELATAVERLTAERPLLLVVEDMHWSDTATLDWLAYVGRRIDPARLLILATYRPVDAIVHAHPLRGAVAELRSQTRHCDELLLDYLSKAQVGEYLTRRFDAVADIDGLAHLLHTRTSGHPLFLVTVVDEFLRAGVLECREGRWQLTAGSSAAAGSIPLSVRRYIEQQVEQLSGEEQGVLEAAAVAGSSFSVAAVAAGLPIGEDALEAHFARWERQGRFVCADGAESWPDGTLAARFRFRHALFQQALYEGVPAGRRARLHRQIGERLESGLGSRSEAIAAELALHFEHGVAPWKAIARLRQAADIAVGRSAYTEARRHLERSLVLLGQLPPARDRDDAELECLLKLGTVQMASRGWAVPEAEQIYRRARALAVRWGAPERLMQVLWGQIALAIVRGELLHTRALAEELAQLAAEKDDRLFRVVAHAELGGTALALGRLAEARVEFERAEALYDPAAHAAYVAQVGVDVGLFARGWSTHLLWHLGLPQQACAVSDAVLGLADSRPYPFDQAIALCYAALLHQLCGDPQRTAQLALAATAKCSEHGFPYYRAWAGILYGWAISAAGRQAEGVEQIRAGIAALRATSGRRSLPYYHAVLAEALQRLGRSDEARDALDEAFGHQRDSGECWWEAELHRLRGVIDLAGGGDTAEAERRLQLARKTARQQGSLALELRAAISLARTWQARGDGRRAGRVLGEVYGRFRKGQATADLREARGLLDLLAG